jgi:methylmalonyl-CoA mutase
MHNKENQFPRILEEFPAHSYNDWREAAEALLNGVPFEKALLTKSIEGFDIQPIYTTADVESLSTLDAMPGMGSRVRGSCYSGNCVNSWLVSQELYAETPEAFNALARHCIERGQDELNILLDGPTTIGIDPDHASLGDVGNRGVSLATVADWEKALEGIPVDRVSLYVRCGLSALSTGAQLFAALKQKGLAHSSVRGCFESDPLTGACELGVIPASMEKLLDETAELTAFASKNCPLLQTIGVQGSSIHNAGGTATQELASILSSGVFYLREMQKRSLAVTDVAAHIRLSVSLGTDYFMEIAKLRALRIVWMQVLESFGVPSESIKIHIHARTGAFSQTQADPYVNMLRATTEAFAAVVGGCDSLHVSPFDEVIRKPDLFSHRIARNVQIILREECDLTRTIDPAGGSSYVEWLTAKLAKEAWKLFQDFEARGGMLSCLKSGIIQGMVDSTYATRQKSIAQRRQVIVGCNMYPNTGEVPLAVGNSAGSIKESLVAKIANYRISGGGARNAKAINLLNVLMNADHGNRMAAAIDASASGATLGEITRVIRKDEKRECIISAIASRRASAGYEELRQSSIAYASLNGSAPQILQINYGMSRKYRLRADWTAAFFQVAGFFVKDDVDFMDFDAIRSAVVSTDAKTAVIVSTDDDYLQCVPQIAQLVKSVRPDLYLIVAGMAGENEAAWRQAGIDDFVNVRVNNYEFNHLLLKKAGAII